MISYDKAPKDIDGSKLKDAIKGKTFVCALAAQETMAHNPQYIIVTKTKDGFYYGFYNDASGLFWEHGPFVSQKSAVSRASCTGMLTDHLVNVYC